jgi:hypothetical protein
LAAITRSHEAATRERERAEERARALAQRLEDADQRAALVR